MYCDAFVELLDDVADPKVNKASRAKPVRDKQLADKSFTAITKGVPGKLAEKVMAKAGEALGDVVVDGAKDVLSLVTQAGDGFPGRPLEGRRRRRCGHRLRPGGGMTTLQHVAV